jgi:hypothetical protein
MDFVRVVADPLKAFITIGSGDGIPRHQGRDFLTQPAERWGVHRVVMALRRARLDFCGCTRATPGGRSYTAAAGSR